jgi:hypothetical protein
MLLANRYFSCENHHKMANFLYTNSGNSLLKSLTLFLFFAILTNAETLTGTKSLSGGTGLAVGTVWLDGNQISGSDNLVIRSVIYPGVHTLDSNAPTGYAISYSVCVNCTNHPVLSFMSGSSVKIVVPINGAVDISWIYTAQPGILQGTQTLSDGSAFTAASFTLDGVQSVPAGSPSFTTVIPAGIHTLLSSAPLGYAVAYSICANCNLHPLSSFQTGYLASVNVPPAGFADVRFQYTPVGAATITVTSPAPNQTVTGIIPLSVTGGNLSKAASVEYAIGSNRIARIAAQPGNPTFQAMWNSALASDGNSQIETTVRDDLDNILVQDVRSVVLSNFGNAATAALPSVFTGNVPVALTAFDRSHFPAYWQVFLDGEIGPNPFGLLFSDQDAVHQNARSTTLDSTAYPNGRHEFHFAFHSNDYPVTNPSAPGLDFRGMVTQNVTVTNPRALMEILPNYLFIYTPVSTGVQLTCTRVYTNQDQDPCSAPAYSLNAATSSPGIQVSASGLVLGMQEGYGDITVSEGGRSALVHVWVRNTPGTPHFQDAGSYGTTYVAGKSLFAIAPFQLTPDLLQADASLYAEVKRAGVNTLNKGIYLPNSNLTLPFSTWKQSFDSSSYASVWAWSLANGFRVLGSGDDIVRRPSWEGYWTANWPGAPQAVQYAMQKFAQSGAGLAVDVVDESSALWGTNPTPVGLIGTPHAMQSATCTGAQCAFTWPSLIDPLENTFHDPLLPGGTFVLAGSTSLTTPAGSADIISTMSGTQANFTIPNPVTGTRTFNATNSPNLEYLWFSGRVSCPGNVMCNPALPNNILSNVAGWLRSATPAVSISWPPAGAAPLYAQRNWLKPGGVSDYASHYWDSIQQRRTYPFGMGVRENQNSMLTAFLGRQSFVITNRPQLLEQSMAGVEYLKYSGAGIAVYSPPADQLLHVGVVPRAVASGIMTAAAVGSAGVKLYKFDNSFAQRRDSVMNGADFESDAGPTTGEVLNWQAMGYASATLSKSLQEFVLGAPVSSPYLGRNIITGARTGPNGNLVIVVNGWDSPRSVQVNLTAYRTGNNVWRYRVGDVSVKLQAMGDIVADTVLLAAGETGVYFFPRTATVAGLDTVSFQPDLPGTKTILKTNYLYSQNTPLYGDPVDCSSGCSVKVDRKLGDVFYSYAVTDVGGTVLCRSAPIAMPAGTSVSLLVNSTTRGSVCQ